MKRCKDEMVNTVVNEGPSSKQLVNEHYQQRGYVATGEANRFLVYEGVSKARLPKLNDVVDVLWDAQGEWFRGRLVKQRGRIRVFRFDVMYDDGDYLTHDLNEEHWRFASDVSKTYEPGEVEELRRDFEEQSFSVSTIEATNQQSRKKSSRRRSESFMKQTSSQSNSDLLKTKTKSQKRASKKRKENGIIRNESALPTLSIIRLGHLMFSNQCTRFEGLADDVTSPVSARSMDVSHSKSSAQEPAYIDTAPLHSVATFASRNRDAHLPFRKRQVVRSNGKLRTI